jgi:hypothetical protein
MKGDYWLRRRLATGEATLVQVYPPKEVLGADWVGNVRISELMFEILDERAFDAGVDPRLAEPDLDAGGGVVCCEVGVSGSG